MKQLTNTLKKLISRKKSAIVIYIFLLICGACIIYISSTHEFESDNCEEGTEFTELQEVKLAVSIMMTYPDTPIVNLETDERIDSFVKDEAHPTNDMTNRGLVTISDGYIWSGTDVLNNDALISKVSPLSIYLQRDKTKFYYTVDDTGYVTGFRDKYGKDKIEGGV